MRKKKKHVENTTIPCSDRTKAILFAMKKRRSGSSIETWDELLLRLLNTHFKS